MVFECMRQLNVYPPKLVVKAGDTVMDILEGKMQAHGLWALLKAPTWLALTKLNIMRLMSRLKRTARKARKIYLDAGADYVIEDITELPEVIAKINESL